ncbi:MAG: TIGR02996 domain-containing protein [Gemmataceae bacterium]|nr:TIGR02996 domain-containing protein [Gemmataceae bacterium]
MSDDERALLAAVVAAPADDTPRLVYADWLEDAGRSDRGAFIRYQVEAERLHPDSNRRAELEARAEPLFAEHWIDWWGVVCEAVGLPLPERPRPTRLGRLARRVVGRSPGWPYNAVTGRAAGWPVEVAHCGIYYQMYRLAREFPPTELGECGGEFFRGFPGRLAFGRLAHVESAGVVRRWAEVIPLGELRLSELAAADWGLLDGPHLAGVSRLTLRDPGSVIPLVLSSPHLGGLSEFRLDTTDPPASLVREVVWVATSVAAPRLRRLAMPLPDEGTALALVTAGRLNGLAALEVELEFEPDISGGVAGPFPPGGDVARLEILAGSPHLAGLAELHVSGVLSAAGVRTLVHRIAGRRPARHTLRTVPPPAVRPPPGTGRPRPTGWRPGWRPPAGPAAAPSSPASPGRAAASGWPTRRPPTGPRRRRSAGFRPGETARCSSRS